MLLLPGMQEAVGLREILHHGSWLDMLEAARKRTETPGGGRPLRGQALLESMLGCITQKMETVTTSSDYGVTCS